MESRPSPVLNSGASGSMSAGVTPSRLSAVTMSSASSRSPADWVADMNETGPVQKADLRRWSGEPQGAKCIIRPAHASNVAHVFPTHNPTTDFDDAMRSSSGEQPVQSLPAALRVAYHPF